MATREKWAASLKIPAREISAEQDASVQEEEKETRVDPGARFKQKSVKVKGRSFDLTRAGPTEESAHKMAALNSMGLYPKSSLAGGEKRKGSAEEEVAKRRRACASPPSKKNVKATALNLEDIFGECIFSKLTLE